MALGPKWEAKKYNGYIYNGVKYHTKVHENNRKTQHSGVLVTAMTSSYASRRDDRPRDGNVCYYGILKEVLELEYFGDLRTMLFRCDWANKERGVVREDLRFTCVNFSHLMHIGSNLLDDPFVFPSQSEQVFYVPDPLNQGWAIAVKGSLRDVYDMNSDVIEEHTQGELRLTMRQLRIEQGDDEINMRRRDLEGTQVDYTI